MRGIVGFNYQDTKSLEKAMLSIKYRGPDDSGAYEESEFSLGHVRLSILDLSSQGHQPMKFENFIIVFNGEIYNFCQLRSELCNKGYNFISKSDTEVVLKAFHCWGSEAVNKFIGIFAFAIYDITSKELFLFRDRVGVKPLYYFFDGRIFAFGSELKALKELNLPLEINEQSLYEFFQFGYISSGNSIYKNCFKLPAGSFLHFKNGEIKINQYWSILPFFSEDKFQKTEKKLIDELEELLIDAFSYRMVSDVPVGVFLSGGTDSSTVAAILQKHYGTIRTFTIGFHEARYNEADYARAVAKHIGFDHTERFLEVDEAKNILNDFVHVYDEPFADSSGIATSLVSRIAKESGVKVVLSADGGDEIFCGYSRYWYTFRIGKIIQKIPSFIRHKLAFSMKLIGPKRASYLFKIHNTEHKYNQLSEMLRGSGWKDWYEAICHNFRNEDIMELIGNIRPISEPSFDAGLREHPMQGMMLWDYHRYMVDNILVKVDRATMSQSIEGRDPLLDHRIAEFMARVPFEYKYRNGVSKYLLRKVLERYIPKNLIDRPKKGFGIPTFDWFKGDLKGLFDQYLTPDRISKEGLLNSNYIKKEYKKFNANQPINIAKLWFILVFEMWYEQHG